MGIGTGHGATISWGQLGGVQAIRNISMHVVNGPAVEITTLTDGNVHNYMDPQHLTFALGAVTGEFLFDSEQASFPPLGVKDTVRITLPVRDENEGGTPPREAGYWEGRAYLLEIEPGTLETNQMQIGSFALQWLDEPTWFPEKDQPPPTQ